MSRHWFLVDMTGRVRRLSKGLLLLLPLGLGVFLVWQEWRFRESLSAPSASFEAAVSTVPREKINGDAIATVLGFTSDSDRLPSAEPLTLQASLVVSHGLSKALIADAQGSQLYQVGQALPGGSVLRRIEPDQVVLWSKGREEVLSLKSAPTTYLRRFELRTDAQASTVPARFLHPYSGPTE